jgi:hypothetical protein
MSEQGRCAVSDWGIAQSAKECEEVYAFRYAHYFYHHTDAPGVDHAKKRVCFAHDAASVHLTGRNAAGELLIVGTGTRASTPNLPESWRTLLQLDRLSSLDLDKILVFSRLVERESCRGSRIFFKFFQYSARYFCLQGYTFTVHYCPPALTPMYEHLGYRLYGQGLTLYSGLYRVPMILVTFDAAHFSRVSSAFAKATGDLRLEGDLDGVLRVLPELAHPVDPVDKE